MDVSSKHAGETHKLPENEEKQPSQKHFKSGPSDSVAIDAEFYPNPFSLDKWIEDNKEELKPPVSNKLVFGKAGLFQIMIIGGPNNRTDYHINEGDEWFWQLKGDMLLKVVDGGVFRDIHIKEGEAFLLPGGIPHSPQRKADTLGLVVERDRWEGELDGLRWYCPNCRHVIYEEFFACSDLGTQLKPVMEKYYASDELRTCGQCKNVDKAPQIGDAVRDDSDDTVHSDLKEKHPKRIIDPKSHPPPQSVWKWIEENEASLKPPICNKLMLGNGADFKIMFVGGRNRNERGDYHVEEGEEFFYQLKGDMVLKVKDGETFRDIPIKEGEVYLHPPNVPHSPQRVPNTIGLVIERERQNTEKKVELDKLRWYCKACRNIVYEKEFYCADLGVQLGPVVQAYYASEESRTCQNCKTVDQPPPKA